MVVLQYVPSIQVIITKDQRSTRKSSRYWLQFLLQTSHNCTIYLEFCRMDITMWFFTVVSYHNASHCLGCQLNITILFSTLLYHTLSIFLLLECIFHYQMMFYQVIQLTLHIPPLSLLSLYDQHADILRVGEDIEAWWIITLFSTNYIMAY